LRESLVIRHKADGQLAGHCFVFVALRELALSKTLPPQPKAKPEVDEDWGQASIFINLAYRRYLKIVEENPSLSATKQTDSLLAVVLFL